MLLMKIIKRHKREDLYKYIIGHISIREIYLLRLNEKKYTETTSRTLGKMQLSFMLKYVMNIVRYVVIVVLVMHFHRYSNSSQTEISRRKVGQFLFSNFFTGQPLW